jgi:hypothetical protein
MNDAHESGFPEISRLAYNLPPMLKDVQARNRKLHFGWVTVMHANQGRRASAAASANMIFVQDSNVSSPTPSQMKGDRRTHYAGAENNNVSGFQKGSVTVAHAAAPL